MHENNVVLFMCKIYIYIYIFLNYCFFIYHYFFSFSLFFTIFLSFSDLLICLSLFKFYLLLSDLTLFSSQFVVVLSVELVAKGISAGLKEGKVWSVSKGLSLEIWVFQIAGFELIWIHYVWVSLMLLVE